MPPVHLKSSKKCTVCCPWSSCLNIYIYIMKHYDTHTVIILWLIEQMCSSQTWWDHHPSKIHLIWVEPVAAAKECSTPWLSQPLPWGTPQVNTKQLVPENQLVGWGENPFVDSLRSFYADMIWVLSHCTGAIKSICQNDPRNPPVSSKMATWEMPDKWRFLPFSLENHWTKWGILQPCLSMFNWQRVIRQIDQPIFEPWRLDHAGRAFDIICQCLENCEMDLSPKTCLDLIKWGFP